MKKVSVIMGVYNCEKTVRESVLSVISQSYENWEMIICDDCSKDGTYEIVKNFEAQYPQKIRAIRNEKNMRLSYTLNHCLKYAKGDYIARMDGDDISLPDRLSKQVSYLDSHPGIDVVGSLMIPFDENGERAPRRKIEIPDKFILRKETPFNHATIMARRKVYDVLNGYTVSDRTLRGQDVDLWFRFYKAGFNGANLQEALYKVREGTSDFKRRTFKDSWNVTRTLFWGFGLLKYPLKYYPYCFKPILAATVPKKMMFYYHRMKDRRNIETA